MSHRRPLRGEAHHDSPSVRAYAALMTRLVGTLTACLSLSLGCGTATPPSVATPDVDTRPRSATPAPTSVSWVCRQANGQVSRISTPPVETATTVDPLVRAGFETLLPAARACVERAPTARGGSLMFHVVTGVDGAPTRTCAAPSPGVDPGLAGCLADVVASIHTVRPLSFVATVDSTQLPAPPPAAARAPFPQRCDDGPVAATDPPPALPKEGGPKASVGGAGAVTGGKIAGAESVIAGAKSRIRGCYQRALTLAPELQGKLVFEIGIGAEGTVARTCTSGEGLEEPVRDCIAGVLRSLAFASPEGGSAKLSGHFTFVNAATRRGPDGWPASARVR